MQGNWLYRVTAIGLVSNILSFVTFTTSQVQGAIEIRGDGNLDETGAAKSS
jgi:hypothetical protein